MTNKARDRTTTGNVLDFTPRNSRSQQESTESWPSASIAAIGRSVDEIKSLFEAQLATAIAHSLQQGVLVDNPFDAVYLSELQPDNLDPAIVTKLAVFSHVKDLSSNIHFDDGLDD